MSCTQTLDSDNSTTMATAAPDPRTFARWEDAFQYPVPVVRRLEQQLRNKADDNREKLRALVGYGGLSRPLTEDNTHQGTARATAASWTRPRP